MKRLWSVALSLALLSGLTPAQDPPFRTTFRSGFDRTGVTFADVWGEGTFAYMGQFGGNGVEFVDVSDPDAATSVLTYLVPPPNAGVSAQDVKAGDGLLFIALESGGADSVQIVDIRTPATPALLTNVNIASILNVHNMFYDSGWLYVCRGAGDGIAIVDLRSYDPDNPPALITTETYNVSGAGSVHDITVVGDRLYVSDISGSLKVYDVGDLANSAPSLLGSIRGGQVHSSWATSDNAFLVTADESFGGPLKLFEVVDGVGSVELVQRDSWVTPLTGLRAAGNAHNPVILGDRVYVSDNAGGVICLQIDRTSKTWELVAAFDTSSIVPAGATGEGCWGIYPFLGVDRVLASDRQTGLFVIDFSALEIAFSAPRPETLAAGASVPLDVTIDELGAVTLDPTTVFLHASVNGAPFTSTAMTSTGGNGWQASFPVLACGDRLDYYVTADDTGGTEFSRPGEAPAQVYTTFGASALVTVLDDDFESDLGWTTAASPGTTAGFFERGVPVDNGFQPPFDDPDGTGTFCYVTQIGTGGNDDVDGGLVTVKSPVMDFTGIDGLISYVRWYYNDDSDGPQSAPLLVQLSSDGGSTWTTVDGDLYAGGGWRRHAFRITDFMAPTSQMVVRFVANDEGNNSLVEAGLDSFLARGFGCPLTLASATFRNGTGVNASCFNASNGPVLGQSWQVEIDASGHPGATATLLVVRASGATGPVIKAGELLVDPASPEFLFQVLTITATPNVHTNAVPYDPALVGVTAAAQGVILGGGVELCNAFDLRVGF